MLVTKRVKHRKVMRGRMTGKAIRGSELILGDYGLKAVEPGWITNIQTCCRVNPAITIV